MTGGTCNRLEKYIFPLALRKCNCGTPLTESTELSCLELLSSVLKVNVGHMLKAQK
jgi:hypothetical protein